MGVVSLILGIIGAFLLRSGIRNSETKVWMFGGLLLAAAAFTNPHLNLGGHEAKQRGDVSSRGFSEAGNGSEAAAEPAPASPLLEWEQDRFARLESFGKTLATLRAANANESAALKTLHAELTAQRKVLDAADTAAVAVFQQRATDYTARVQALKTSLASADQIEAKIAIFRSAQPPEIVSESAVKAGRRAQVTIYSTSRCGACKAAKRWFDSHGIPYTERDVQKDPAARMVFNRMGVNSVPLIMIGSRRIVGFDEGEIRDALGM